MKKIFLIAFIIALGSTTVNAQEANAQEKSPIEGFFAGDFYITGSLGFNRLGYGNINSFGNFATRHVYFLPTVGHFVSNNVSLEMNFKIRNTTDFNDLKEKDLGVSAGAIYFFTPSKQFSIHLGAFVGYTDSIKEFQFEESDFPDVRTLETKTFSIEIVPGVNYFISKSFALNASIGALSFENYRTNYKEYEDDNKLDLNLNFSNLNFGITYKF